MTTRVFTQAIDADLSKVSIQIVLPLDKETKRYVSEIFRVKNLMHLCSKRYISYLSKEMQFCGKIRVIS